MIGKYECDGAVPSIDAAKKIADVFEISLDYLAGEEQAASFDKKTLKRLGIHDHDTGDSYYCIQENKQTERF